jgi:hypothetical protein
MDINEIIELYTNQNYSTHKLAEIFKVGHKKISQILKDNNIEIRKRGGQVKDGNSDFISNSKTIIYNTENGELVAKCRKTGVIINDPNNLSGKLTKHIQDSYENILIPSNAYQRKKYELTHGKKWFEEYFEIIQVDSKEQVKCDLCEWSTYDLTNKTGSLKKHIESYHSVTIMEYVNNFPSKKYLFKNDINQHEKEQVGNHIICKVCGEILSSLTNTHMKKHNMTISDYKLKFPNSKTVSNATSNKLREIVKEVNLNMKPTWTSKGEIEVKEFIESLGLECEKSKNRGLINGKEIDIVIPSLNIGVEYNGLYYHTEKMGKNQNYHLEKTIECNEKGYKLIQIFEDEWILKNDLVKEKLKHILLCGDGEKIGARKTKIKPIDTKTKKEFLSKFHIQGNDKSSIYYGAYYGELLVGVMTFNSKRNMTSNNEGEYELSRFCTDYRYNITGLGSKILKQFISDYLPKTIISFADRRWTINTDKNLYINMGFELVSITKPNYSYYNSKVNRYRRFHKFSFGKNNLKSKYPNLDMNKSESELTKELGFSKIWDCGLFKYRYIVK